MKSTPPPTETRRSPRIASPAASVKAKATPPHSPKVTNPPRRKSPLANKANLKNPAANISGRRRSNSLPTKSAEKQTRAYFKTGSTWRKFQKCFYQSDFGNFRMFEPFTLKICNIGDINLLYHAKIAHSIIDTKTILKSVLYFITSLG